MNEINLLNGLSGIGLSATQVNAVMSKLATAQAGTPAQNAIVNHLLPNLDAQTQQAVGNGEYKNEGMEFFYNVILTSQGQLDIVDPSVAEAEGVTNLSWGRIPMDINGVVTRIEVNQKTVGGVTLKNAAYAPLAATDDAALLNGSIEVKIAGKRLVKQLLNSFHHSPNVADQSSALQNGYNLKTPHPFLGGSTVEFNFKPANGATIAATGCAFQVKLITENLIRKPTLK